MATPRLDQGESYHMEFLRGCQMTLMLQLDPDSPPRVQHCRCFGILCGMARSVQASTSSQGRVEFETDTETRPTDGTRSC